MKLRCGCLALLTSLLLAPAAHATFGLVADYVPAPGAARTQTVSYTADPTTFVSYHYDEDLGPWVSRPGATCPGANDTYFRLGTTGATSPIVSVLVQFSWDAAPFQLNPAAVSLLNQGQTLIIGTDSFDYDPATCARYSPRRERALPGVTHWVTAQFTLQQGTVIDRQLRFTKSCLASRGDDCVETEVGHPLIVDVMANEMPSTGAVSSVSSALHGTVSTFSDCCVLYTPPAQGYQGPDHFSYTRNGSSQESDAWIWVDTDPRMGSCPPREGTIALTQAFGHQIPDNCNWRARATNSTFPTWDPSNGIGSQNIPVVSSAVGLRYDPTPDRLAWWETFFDHQLGRRDDFGGEHQLKYLQGSELTSNIYDRGVLSSIVAVHYWSRRLDDRARYHNLGDRARDYLRAVFTIYSLAAGDGPARHLWYRFDNTVPIRRNDADYDQFRGPYVALAGMRTHLQGGDPRAQILQRAAKLPGFNHHPADVFDDLITAIQGSYPGGAANLYGLSSTEVARLQEIIYQDGTAGFQSFVAGMLGQARTITGLNILAWDGVRASYLDQNKNSNTANFYAAAWFRSPRLSSTGPEVHVLFPWEPSCDRRQITRNGYGQLNLAGETVEIEASNGPPSGNCHPLRTERITNLPPYAKKAFAVRIDSGGVSFPQ